MTTLQIILLIGAFIAFAGALALRLVSTAKERDSEFGVMDED